MSQFVFDASFALTWCFPDRATANTDDLLRRMESHADDAIAPWVWQLEVGNALGKAATRNKLSLDRAVEIWEELLLLPIRLMPETNVSALLRLAVRHNLSIYDASYLQAALTYQLPLATIDQVLGNVASSHGVKVLTP